MNNVTAAMDKGGYPELARHVDELRQVLSHMPSPYAARIARGGVTTVYAHTAPECLVKLIEAAAAATKGGATAAGATVCDIEPYSRAALMLGMHDNQIRHPVEAIEVLDRGLEAWPSGADLSSEKGVALVQLHRWGDALAAYETGLHSDDLDDLRHARLLRGEGYCLTELHRLDEAEAAYRQSLKLDPGHAGAQRELQYIAALRTGGQPDTGDAQLTTSDKARLPQ